MRLLASAAALAAWAAVAAPGAAQTVTEGPASAGSVRYANQAPMRPSEHRAETLRSPSERQAAGQGQSPSAYGRAEAVTTDSLRRETDPVDPSSRQAQAISPSDRPAADPLRPGETRTREIHNPRRYGRQPATSGGVATTGPATHGSVRQPSYANPWPSDGQAPAPSGGFMDLSGGARWSAAAGMEGPSSTWYARRVMSKTIYEGWRCDFRKYVDFQGETLRLCGPTWVRRLMWAGQTGYVAIYPPEGLVLPELPGEYDKVTHGGTTYRVANATFYVREPDDGFRVVRPPVGAVVPSIPRFALELDGGVFQYDDVFYRRSGSGYAVVVGPS